MRCKNKTANQSQGAKEQDGISGKSLRLYLPGYHKLASLLCLYPVILGLLNLSLYPIGEMLSMHGFLLLGASLYLLLFTFSYSFAVRVILGKKRFSWRSKDKFRLQHCRYSAIRQLQIRASLEQKQTVYDLRLRFHYGHPQNLSLGFINSKRLVRALSKQNVPVAPELLHYFLYSHSREGRLLERNWGRLEHSERFRKHLRKVLHRKKRKKQGEKFKKFKEYQVRSSELDE